LIRKSRTAAMSAMPAKPPKTPPMTDAVGTSSGAGVLVSPLEGEAAVAPASPAPAPPSPANAVTTGSVVEVSQVEDRVDDEWVVRDDVVLLKKCEWIVLLLKECRRADGAG
jgi:hypothetical protein